MNGAGNKVVLYRLFWGTALGLLVMMGLIYNRC